MALMLHELMTNAAKYGALSTASGVVTISWRVEGAAPRILHVRWQETGGPPVVSPSRAGFGTRLINYNIKELRGAADVRFEPQGLDATFKMPLT
jgi:two-component sensor histidine kinase